MKPWTNRLLHHLPRALLLAMLVSTPLIAAQNVSAGHANIIEGRYEKPRGAGFVIMMSLRRAR